jgi:hypothetical protein
MWSFSAFLSTLWGLAAAVLGHDKDSLTLMVYSHLGLAIFVYLYKTAKDWDKS